MEISTINRHIGLRLRQERRRRELTQTDLAKACGVTFQQIQKYESGVVMISAERLWRLSAILDIGVWEFFPRRDGAAAASPTAEPMRIDA